MEDKKTPKLRLDLSVSCDDYDINGMRPRGDIHLAADVEDAENGTKRRLDVSVKSGSKVGGEWGALADRLLGVVNDLPSLMGEEWFRTDRWGHTRHNRKTAQGRIGADFLEGELWIGLGAPIANLAGEYPNATLYVSGHGNLILPEDEMEGLMAIEPYEWWLPSYQPSDWLAHKGFFSQLSFGEDERSWTKEKILRGLEVAADELSHYRRMARIFEQKTGMPVIGGQMDE